MLLNGFLAYILSVIQDFFSYSTYKSIKKSETLIFLIYIHIKKIIKKSIIYLILYSELF